MIIFFLFYFIALIWLLHIETLETNQPIDVDRNITFVIDKVRDVGSIIITLDSIIESTKNIIVNIILIDNTKQDLNSITKEYQKQFASMEVIKNNTAENLNFIDEIDQKKHNMKEFIVLKSGVMIGNNFFNSIYNAIYQMKESIIFLPISLYGKRKKISFFQLYNFLIQSIESSLINKKIILKKISKSSGYIVKVDSIDDMSNQASLVHRDLVLTKKYNEGDLEVALGYFKFLFFITNLLLIISICHYAIEPSMILFLAIVLKIVPEFILIYSYYNKLHYKFPKFEFVVFSIVQPFYMFYKIYNERNSYFK